MDYRDLSVRHLGTIYEGLLENHLENITPEDEWSVALLNDKGERKATGSYYTPDFIVKYIVRETLQPILMNLQGDRALSDAEWAEAVLSLNVLDPAMGSGHFLVEATEYLAGFLVEMGIRPPDAEDEEVHDLDYWKRKVAQSCIYGVDLNPLAVELAKLSLWLVTVARDRPLSFLDHHLRTGNSLIGAHISEISLSTPKARTNRKRELVVAEAHGPVQLSMLGENAFQQALTDAVATMWQIEENPGQTIDQVKEQEQIYAQVREGLNRRYGKLTDLETARHFGLEIDLDSAQQQSLVDYATGRTPIAAMPQFVRWLDEATSMAERQRFFHWELEFPEVFFDRQGRPLGEKAGFDAVIGNPPYVRQEALKGVKPYFAAVYPETYHGVADLYVYFYQQGLRLTRRGGRMSYIVTNKWMKAGYGEPLRAFFASQGALEQIIDFGHAPIFEEADVFPCIVVLEKRLGDADADGKEVEHTVQVTTFPRKELNKVDLGRYVRDHGATVSARRFGKDAWNLEATGVGDLMKRIREAGIPLSEYAGAKPYRGILTGLNEAFLIDSPTRERLVRDDPHAAEIIKPYLRGQDMGRWIPTWHELWMIFTRRGVNIEAYPSIHHYLAGFRERLEPKPRNWNGRDWGGRKTGSYKWYEIQDAVDYWELFERPKILYQEIQFHAQYALDMNRLYTNNKVFLLPSTDPWLLAVLNSPLMWWHNWRYLPHMKDEALSPAGMLMEFLPIAPPTEVVRSEVEPSVERLIGVADFQQQSVVSMLDWLRTEFDVQVPGQRLENFAALDPDAFVEEVRKRRPRSAGRLSPAALKDLRVGYNEQALPLQKMRQEAGQRERRLAELVNLAYGLTPEEVELLWSTAPPRMPVANDM